MKPKIYVILEECVERGVLRGYRRAHKHNENPDENAIMSSIENCIMASILEYFEFNPSGDYYGAEV